MQYSLYGFIVAILEIRGSLATKDDQHDMHGNIVEASWEYHGTYS